MLFSTFQFNQRPPNSAAKQNKNYCLELIFYMIYAIHDPQKEMYLRSIGYRTKMSALTKAKFINENTLNQNP